MHTALQTYVVHIALQSKPMNNKVLNIRVPENEFDVLTRWAAQTRRTKTEIVREFLRSLERRLERDPVSARPVSQQRVSARAPAPKKPSAAKKPRP